MFTETGKEPLKLDASKLKRHDRKRPLPEHIRAKLPKRPGLKEIERAMKLFKPILLAGFSSTLLGAAALAQPAPSPSYVASPEALRSFQYNAFPNGVWAGQTSAGFEPLFYRGQAGACPASMAWNPLAAIPSSRARGAPEGCFVAAYENTTALPSCNPVLAYGADPTGVVPAARAIQACADTVVGGRRLNVELPPGTFYMTEPITLQNGQELYGSGTRQTRLRIDDAFDPAALGVIVLPNLVARGANAIHIHDLTFSFVQPSTQTVRANYQPLGSCTSSSGGTGCKYSPAIYGTNNSNLVIERIMVANGWDGFNLTGNPGLSTFRDIEMGAANVGLKIDGAHGNIVISNWVNWVYSDPTANAGFFTVYGDGGAIAWQFGEVDGISADHVYMYHASIEMSNVFGSISNLGFDGGCVSITGGSFLAMSNIYYVDQDPYTCTVITVSGGNTIMSGLTAVVGGSPLLNVTGGRIAIHDFDIRQPTTDNALPIATQSGTNSQMKFSGGRMALSGGAGAATKIASTATGTSITIVEGVDFSTTSDPTANPLITIANDVRQSSVRNNNLGHGRFTPPGPLGAWGPNQNVRQETITPTVTFSTPGDFVPQNVTGGTTWFPIGGGLYYYKVQVSFDTNAYTTAAGFFEIVPNFPLVPTTTMPAEFGPMSGLVFSASTQVTPEIQTTGRIRFRVMTSGAASAFMGTSAVPASTTGFNFTVSGIARYQ